MAKNKKFREWIEEESLKDEDMRFRKKDSKRYDKRRANIQKARRQKNKQKESFFNQKLGVDIWHRPCYNVL
jgi:hypothetical protein